MNRKKFILDSFLNIVSSALPLIVLQFLSLPLVLKISGNESYGIIITIISIYTVISFPVGNVLNNIRLLKNETYVDKNISGDFNYLLIGSSIASSLLMVIISIYFFDNMTFLNLFLLVTMILFSITREYLIVSYRISLDFKGIFKNNTLMGIGYILGTYFYYLTEYWELIYLVGLLFSLFYILFTTNLLSEPYNRTAKFRTTFKDFLYLLGAGLLKNFLNYADKIILLPLLGPKNVSIYYTASIIGKIVLMIFNPINSVILSYITKMKRMNNKTLLKIISVAGIFSLFVYLATIIISPFFLNIFYPSLAGQSIELIYITSAASIISVISLVVHPFNLRYNNIKWQVYISIINLIFYIFITFLLTYYFALKGFAVAVLLSGVFSLLIQFYIYFFKNDNNV